MSNKSAIEWTEHTWNPITGCSKVSPGCDHCYAENMARRLRAMGTKGYENGFELKLMRERLDQPLRRKTPTKYFVNSMSDLFHEEVPFAFIEQIISVIDKTPQHAYQILTKRAERMAEFFHNRKPPANAWIGVTVENVKHGLPRIDHLRQIDATIRFISAEPLLEDLGKVDLSNIHWCIVGGESGNQARPLKEEWVQEIQKQCEQQKVAFFFKQWGTWGADGIKRSKKHNGRKLKGRVWDEMPNFPETSQISY